MKLEYLKLDLHSKLKFYELEFQKVVYCYLFCKQWYVANNFCEKWKMTNLASLCIRYSSEIAFFLLVKIAFLILLRKKRICPHEVKISSGSIANVSISPRSLIVIDCRSSRIQIDSLKYQFLENRIQQ